MHAEEIKLLAAAGLWLAALVFTLTWIAGRHPILAGVTAAVQVTSAWAFLASLTIGPADVQLRWAWQPRPLALDLRYDYGQAWGWATGSPWELYAVVAALFTWCLLRRALRKRKITREATRVAEAAELAAARAALAPWTVPAPRRPSDAGRRR